MTDVSFEFPFHPLQQRDRTLLYPLVPVTLRFGDGNRQTHHALLDSGADRSVLPVDAAEALGIPMDPLPGGHLEGVGGGVASSIAPVDVEVRQGNVSYSDTHWMHVLTEDVGWPLPVLLGREPLFHIFDVEFRLSDPPGTGWFQLRRNHRCPSVYLGEARFAAEDHGSA